MKNNYLKIIKDTLETSKNIIVLSMSDEGITNEYGHEIIVIYINNIEESLSFINKNEPSLHIPIEGYSIHLIELGYLLKSIYHNPKSFLFIDCLRGQNNYMIEDDEDGENYYVDIINTVKDNPPLLLVKNYIIEEIDKLAEGFDISYVYTGDFALLLNLCQYLIDNKMIKYDKNFLKEYIGERQNEQTVIKIINDLNAFKQELGINFHPDKITEMFIRNLDELYINAQIIYSSINND